MFQVTCGRMAEVLWRHGKRTKVEAEVEAEMEEEAPKVTVESSF